MSNMVTLNKILVACSHVWQMIYFYLLFLTYYPFLKGWIVRVFKEENFMN